MNTLKRIKIFMIASSFTAAAMLGGYAVFGALTSPAIVKLNPIGVQVESSGAWIEDSAVWALFDRDTASAYTPSAPVRVMVTLPALTDITAVKVYGSASYNIAVYDGSTGSLIPGLEAIALRSQSTAWNAFAPASPVSTNKLILEFTAAGGNEGGVKEIEIWGNDAGDTSLTLKGIKTAADVKAILTASPRPAHIAELAGTPRQLDVPADGDSRAVSFSMSFDPKLIKRAYLLYDSYNADYPVSPEKRINNLSWTGGFFPTTSDTPEWKSQIEEINPAWLVKGENTIEFRNQVTGRDPSSYFIRDLKVIAELENGWNTLAAVTGTAENENHSAEAAFDGDLTTYFELKGSHILDLKAERTIQPDAVRINLWSASSTPSGSITLQYPQGNQWKNLGSTIDMATLRNGWNEIKIPTAVAVDTIRLNIQVTPDKKREGATVGGINEVELIASPIGARPSRGLVVNYPQNGEYFARTAYIQGFVDPASNQSGPAQLSIEGKPIPGTDGSFSVALTKDDTRFAGQSDNDAWEAVVTASYQGGAHLTRTIALNKNLLNNSPTSTSNSSQASMSRREKFSEKVAPGQAKKIQYKGVTLDIPAGAVDQDTEITIMPLTEADLARLNPGMINVTFPDAGYRFLPHGMKFKKPIKISFGYSKQLFAAGQTDDEVNMYYYDEAFLKWQRLMRVNVDAALSLVTSESDHFTDIINSTLVVPEHPEALTFNPNSIKDIKAADPSANINLIEPPKANNKGTANLSYPIEVPPGRNKLQPNLVVQYNSSGGNGWTGLGWDLSMPSISIDTRFGAPVYDEAKRKETYLLNGQQMVLAPNGEYRLRVEGQFSRIVRHGSSPGTYWWVVTDKSGARYVYGGDSTAQLRSADETKVFTWYLSRIVDTNGNTVDYIYNLKKQDNHNGGEQATYAYIREIRYPGNAGKGKSDDQIRNVPATAAGSYYRITFVNDTTTRLDVIVDGRPGFKTVLDERLKSIVEDVVLSKEIRRIRRYEFNYKQGDFDKTLLESVVRYGSDDRTEFSRHSFEYFTMPATRDGYDAFEPVQSWSIPAIDGGLSLTKNDDKYAGIYLGFMLYTDALHIGAGWGWGEGKSDTELTTLDVNGDGLPDFVQKRGPFYRNNWDTDAMAGSAFNQTALIGSTLDTLGKEENKVKSFEVGLHIGKHDGMGSAWKKISLSRGKTRTEIKGTAIMADINGDGLPDQLFISGGTLMVRLNKGKGFDAPINWAGGVNIEPALTAEEKQKLLDEFPLMDPVRAWKAPFNGIVSVSGTVAKPDPSSVDKGEDGVTISFYKGNSSAPLWEKVFLQAESVNLSTIASLQRLAVDRGELIYAKVSSIEDSNNDKLNTDITVSYDSVNGYESAVVTDPRFDQTVTGDPMFSSNSGNAFAMAAVAPQTLAVNPAGTWMAPYKGKIRLTNTITKLASSEDLRFRVIQVDENERGEVISTQTLLDQTVSAATATTINQLLEDHQITADTKLIFDISAPKLGTVRSDRVTWISEVQYVNLCTRQRSGVDIDNPATFTPQDGQSANEYLNEEVCTDLTDKQQEMTDRDLPGALPPDDGTPPVKLFLFKPTPVLNVYPFKRLKPTEAWVAPRTGTIRIVTHSHKLVETPSEVHLKIQSTNQLISQFTYSTDEIRQINLQPLSVINVPVTEGQRLFFNIVSKETITPETVLITDPNNSESTISVPSVAWDHEILYVDSPHCYMDPSTNTQKCAAVDKKFPDNYYRYYGSNPYNNTIWTMHFDSLCLAPDRCVIVDCTGNRRPGSPIALTAASCQTTEYIPNPDPNKPPVLVHNPVTQAERAATGLDRYEYFVPAVNRDSLEWQENDRSPLFGFYRDWAYVVWNGNKIWDPAKLVVPENVDTNPNPTDEDLNRMQPPDFWQAKPFGFGTNRYLDVPLWSAGGFDYLSMNETMPFRTGGNITPFIKVPTGAGISNLRKTKNEQTKTSLGIGPLGASLSKGPAKTEIDLIDMNGNRYPDLVSSNGTIVFNHGTPGSGFDTEHTPVDMAIRGEGALRRIESKTASLSFGAGGLFNEPNSNGKQVKIRAPLPTVGTGYGSSRTVVELIDINGDGLPDRVYRDGDNIIVRLNLGGNRFGQEENWTAGGWSVSNISRLDKLGPVSPNAIRATDTVSANVSGGGGIPNTSVGGSVSLGVNGSRTIVDLIDINGDGLPDLVMKEHGKDYFLVRINRGNSFGPEKKWYVPGWGTTIGRGATATLYGGNDVLGYNEGWTLTGGLNATIHFSFTIGVVTVHIFIEPDANISTGQGSSSLALMDVNGDGIPDQVYRANATIGGAGSSEVRIKYSKVGKTNLLKTVKRPLGGKIALNYERRGNKVNDADPAHLIDMPHSQWVLTNINLNDGMGNGMGHTYTTAVDYGKGFYSREEREFYGFDQVIETQALGTALQRSVTEAFDNQDYYLKGLVLKTVTTDQDGNAWARTVNTYDKAAVKVMHGQGAGGTVVAGSKFPWFLQTDTYFYTGSTNENSYAKSTAQKFIHDDYGNIARFTDFGDEGGADDLNADIGYWTVDTDDSYMSKPSSITVTGQSGNDVYRKRTADYEAVTGNLAQLTMSIAQSGSTPAVWNMHYDSLGNLDVITFPAGDPNHNEKKNARYFIGYSYDPELAIYAASITDSFGYVRSRVSVRVRPACLAERHQ